MFSVQPRMAQPSWHQVCQLLPTCCELFCQVWPPRPPPLGTMRNAWGFIPGWRASSLLPTYLLGPPLLQLKERGFEERAAVPPLGQAWERGNAIRVSDLSDSSGSCQGGYQCLITEEGDCSITLSSSHGAVWREGQVHGMWWVP